MNVYLVRHAVAVPRDPAGVLEDAARCLTDKGTARMRRIVRALRRLRVDFDEIWTSPLIRARQTAELLAESPRFSGNIRVVEALQPGGAAAALVAELQRFAGQSLALVGHEPDLGKLASHLIWGQTLGAVTLKKGGVARIDLDSASSPVRGDLHWLLTPRQLRLMA